MHRNATHVRHRAALRDRIGRGQSTTEVIVLLALVGLAIVVAVRTLGTQVRTKYDCASEAVATAEASAACSGTAGTGEGEGGAPRGANPGPSFFRRILSALGFGGAPAAPPAAPPSSTAAPPAQTPEQAALAEARKILERLPAGKQLLDFADRNGITIELLPGDGYFFDPVGKRIVLNPPYDPEELALKFLHEVNHAIFSIDGKTADPTTLSRDEYVARMIEEEVAGTVLPIEFKKALAQAGTPIAATFPLEAEYDAAYAQAVQDLKNANPSATPSELDKAGRDAGAAAVKNGFETGKVTASVLANGKVVTYPEYYGMEWDAQVLGAGMPSSPPP
jgi:Flp pilus assembly pilin Flp